MHNGSMISRVG